MRGIRLEELLAEIRANFVAFFSIMMFVCLGVGLFWGIHWSGAALRGAADRFYERGALHDIEVQYPYGLTADDLAQIKAVEGVSDAELGYVGYATILDEGGPKVVKIEGLTERIDTPTVEDGRLPVQAGEVAVLAQFAQDDGLSLGDVIVLEHDADGEDPDGMRELTCDKLVVVGVVNHPAYLSSVKAAYGVAPLGTGDIDGVAFVHNDSFSSDAFDHAFPRALIRCDALRGLDSYANEYRSESRPVIDALEALGKVRAKERYDALYADAQSQIDDAATEVADAEAIIQSASERMADNEKKLASNEQQLEEGGRQLDEGAQQLADGRQQLAEGERQLEAGKDQLAAAESELDSGEREIARKKEEFAEKQQELEDAQESYDEKREDYESYEESYQNITKIFETVRPTHEASMENLADLRQQRETLNAQVDALDEAIAAYETVNNDPETTDEERDAAWTEVQAAYDSVAATHAKASVTYVELVTNVRIVFAAFGENFDVPDSVPELAELSRDDPHAAADSGRAAIQTIDETIGALDGAQLEDSGGRHYSYADPDGSFRNARQALDEMKQQLDEGKERLDGARTQLGASKETLDDKVADAEAQIAQGRQQLASKRTQLEEARRTLAVKRAEYEAALSTYQEKKTAYEEGKVALAQAKEELEEAKQELERMREEVEEGKQQVEDATEALGSLKEYGWFVVSRIENGGVSAVSTISQMMENVRWAMALLFVLVGLFVCYAAILRLVHDEAVQIGTKKAMGFRESEIAAGYLAFSGIAVLMGTALAAGVSTLVVEGIINPATSRSFVMPAFAPHFDLPQLLLGGGIELVLILLSTWMAIHGMLKRNAIFLLNGGQEAKAKTRAYERTALWRHLSLYSQTIINNCVNDRRRVAATLIGVVGCTSLIVTAVTLWNDVSRSFDCQYERVYDFDTTISLDEDVEDSVQGVDELLEGMDLDHAALCSELLRVELADGRRQAVTLCVPTDVQQFERLYHLNVMEGNKDLYQGGLLISSAYAKHNDVGVGDTIELLDAIGQAHPFKVAGIHEFYLLRHEFVLSAPAYEAEFGEPPAPNTFMVQLGDADRSQVSAALAQVEGYEGMRDDYTASHYAYGELERVLKTVVMVYLGLSALMALIVLLNLDIMFVEERKRELIVLMINGFSTGDAKAYIYRDSIVLTVVGIVLGVILGSFMGVVTVHALEPGNGWFLKSFSALAAVVGTVGAGALSTVVLLYALRRIPRFKLSDINLN